AKATPPVPKPVSGVPSGLNLEAPSPAFSGPATTILPSGWTASAPPPTHGYWRPAASGDTNAVPWPQNPNEVSIVPGAAAEAGGAIAIAAASVSSAASRGRIVSAAAHALAVARHPVEPVGLDAIAPSAAADAVHESLASPGPRAAGAR